MWKLMNNAITDDDKKHLCTFIMSSDQFTNGDKVREFEEAWSKWQGCKHSVFVNSGSSANLILVYAIKHLFGVRDAVAQAVTWSTNVAPFMQFGYNLQLCDVDMKNLGPDLDSLKFILSSSPPSVLFLTHVLGLNAITPELLQLLSDYGTILLEDCCEATGAKFGDIKVGNYGIGSTFSFYYGHHMTTIEGGMVCTDHDDLYDILRMMRSHGLSRESSRPSSTQHVHPNFTFLLPGFNVRSTEINAVLGLRKIQSLQTSIDKRNANLLYLLKCLDPDKFYTKFSVAGSSSFALPIISIAESSKTRTCLDGMGIEHRPLISGSLYHQPFMKSVNQKRFDANAEIIHKHGLYVGNHETVELDMIGRMCAELNNAI